MSKLVAPATGGHHNRLGSCILPPNMTRSPHPCRGRAWHVLGRSSETRYASIRSLPYAVWNTHTHTHEGRGWCVALLWIQNSHRLLRMLTELFRAFRCASSISRLFSSPHGPLLSYPKAMRLFMACVSLFIAPLGVDLMASCALPRIVGVFVLSGVLIDPLRFHVPSAKRGI